jgi:hypothetical protein
MSPQDSGVTNPSESPRDSAGMHAPRPKNHIVMAPARPIHPRPNILGERGISVLDHPRPNILGERGISVLEFTCTRTLSVQHKRIM